MTDDMTLDIIREVVNIGIGDAASALSVLINSRVSIKVPDIHILNTPEASAFIQQEIGSLGIYIAQDFQGVFRGKALLFYSKKSCSALLNAITGDISIASAMTETAMATLQEIGNIIMVSCITTISNMLEDTVEFQVPDVTLEISENYFKNLVKGHESLDKTIIVRNQMVIQDKEIEGYFIILLSYDDFLLLIEKMAEKIMKQS